MNVHAHYVVEIHMLYTNFVSQGRDNLVERSFGN